VIYARKFSTDAVKCDKYNFYLAGVSVRECAARMPVRYGTVYKYGTVRSNFKPKIRWRWYGTLKRICISTIRWYGTVNFSRYWNVVRTFLTPKTRYGTWSTVRFL